MKISVTKADIAKGKHSHPANCPVALAFKRLGFPGVIVGYGFIWGVIKGGLPIPLKAARFMRKFDASEKGKPFTFTLPIP